MQRVLIVEVYTPPVAGVSEGRYSIERMEGGRTGGPWPKENVRVLGVEGSRCHRPGCKDKASHVVIYTSTWDLGSRMDTVACPVHTEEWRADAEAEAEAHAFRD